MSVVPGLVVPSRDDIARAADRIRGRVRRTPVLDLGRTIGPTSHVVLKLELLQHSGSFKARGAFNRLLASEVPPAGVLVASGGNAGLAAAYAARELGHRAEVFVPATAPEAKVRRLKGYGAHVVSVGATYAEALLASEKRAAETGALVLHAYDQPEVVAGQGTVAVELAAQAPGLDTVLVAVGGGGLVAGIALWLAGAIKVVAVEAEGSPTLHAAREAGQPVEVEVGGVAADALGARRIGDIAWAVSQSFVSESVLVSGEAVMAARQMLWDEARVAAEPGGATAMAALLTGAYRAAPGERVGVVVCGGNSDPSTLVP